MSKWDRVAIWDCGDEDIEVFVCDGQFSLDIVSASTLDQWDRIEIPMSAAAMADFAGILYARAKMEMENEQ